MQNLFSGLHQFHTRVFQQERDFFEKLSTGQSPQALFISCSDSRVVPDLIMMTNPGDLFVVRNAGNIVPPFGASNGGEGPSIEFALCALGVRDIVICGHSQCGAIKALLDPPSTAKLPLVRNWLQHAETTRQIMEENYGHLTPEQKLEVAVQEHVLVQLENLQTHPAVAVRLQRGELTLHGWVYELETGQVHAYSSEKNVFEPLMGEQAMKSSKLVGPVTPNVLPLSPPGKAAAEDGAPKKTKKAAKKAKKS